MKIFVDSNVFIAAITEEGTGRVAAAFWIRPTISSRPFST
jgi:predicted nucleic acid-binding protein